jgi:predicted RNA-binding protein with PUA-like domain
MLTYLRNFNMAYWLIKSEPTHFSIDKLAASPDKTTAWDGVRNYQARNYLKSMQKSDKAFFYHSSCEIPGIAGIVEIIKEAYPEKNQGDKPQWFCVDVKLVQKFSHVIALSELKKLSDLKEMIILRKGNRLSVTPVLPKEWEAIMDFSKSLMLSSSLALSTEEH